MGGVSPSSRVRRADGTHPFVAATGQPERAERRKAEQDRRRGREGERGGRQEGRRVSLRWNRKDASGRQLGASRAGQQPETAEERPPPSESRAEGKDARHDHLAGSRRAGETEVSPLQRPREKQERRRIRTTSAATM